MDLNDVSKTALVTLRSRVIESRRKAPLLKDPMAEYCLAELERLIPGGKKESLLGRKFPRTLTLHIALRARKYDALSNAFIHSNPGCTVVNLGCGLDTRYWRIDHENCNYMELDLPEVIQLKKEIFRDRLYYPVISSSVLDESWIKNLTKKGDEPVLLLAEGLFMYLNTPDVQQIFKRFSESFFRSQIIFEVVTRKYTQGVWKKIVEMKMRRNLDLEAGSSYNFGLKKAEEIEYYGSGLKVTGEWSYVEDPDVRPRILKYMGISRTQWTIIASIN